MKNFEVVVDVFGVKIMFSQQKSYRILENQSDKQIDSEKGKNLIMYIITRFRFRSVKAFVISFFIAFLLIVFYNAPFAYKTNQFKKFFYTIVIDAGSTGSRIHVFKLDHNSIENSDKLDIKLVNEELFEKIKPGLSSFSKEPAQAINTIKPLLDKALLVIPKQYHEMTKFTLKATAGLRMISDKIANQILDNVRNLLKKYPFLNTYDDVSIMDGKFEGVYSWITLNYALNNFQYSREHDFCSLDLGGGSTQMTFIPTNKITLESFKNDHIDFKIDTVKYKIYAKSFLGFGLMSARMNIFRVDNLKLLLNNEQTINTELTSVCIAIESNFIWRQQGIDYTVKGFNNQAKHSFENCYKSVTKTIENKINAPVELRDKEIYAFSFYYDRLNSAKLLKDSSGGLLQISDIFDKAKSVCNNPKSIDNISIDKIDKDYPFLCMDLTFIYTLLSQGFGLPNDKQINVHNQVNKMEISWALGAAFHMINE